MPGAIDLLLEEAAKVKRFGFIQGTKIELDASRTYHNDINRLIEHDPNQSATRIWFGDAAFLLLDRAALGRVDWELMTRFREENLPGEDVAMTLMIADREPCYGVAAAAGYHMSLSAPRWRWEVPSDLLQFEMLKPVVSAETLEKAMPHLAKYIRNQADSAPDGASVNQPHAEGKPQ